MARKAKGRTRGIFPIINPTNFYFKPGISPLFRALLFFELIICSFCVLGAVFLVVLKFVNSF